MSSRLLFLDIGKGIVTLLMIFSHSIFFFSTHGSIEYFIMNLINLIAFPSFLLFFGYAVYLSYFEKQKKSKLRILKNFFRILIAFYISSFSFYILILHKNSIKDYLDILLLKNLAGFSEFLISFALYILLIFLFFDKVKLFMDKNPHFILFIVFMVSTLSTFIPNHYDIHTTQISLFLGTKNFPTFPIIQYLICFILGMYLAKTKKENLIFFIFAIIMLLLFILHEKESFFSSLINCRFPPSYIYIWGSVGISYIIYFLLSKTEKFFRKILPITLIFANVGSNVLLYLLLSNIFIFCINNIIKNNLSLVNTALITLFLLLTINYMIFITRKNIQSYQ